MGSKYKFLPSPATGFLTDADTRRYLSRFGFAVFALSAGASLAAFFISLAHSAILNTFFPSLLTNTIYTSIAGQLLSIICIYGVGFPLFLLISRGLPKISPLKSSMNASQIFGSFCVTSLMTMVGNYISSIIIVWFSLMFGSSLENPVSSMVEGTSVWVTIAFGVIIIPILEELVFRKAVCDRLTALGEGYAIFLSAATFSLVHGNFFQFAYAFLLGALFGLIYVKTGKLIYSIILHMSVNFLGMVVSQWLVSLIDMDALLALLESDNPVIPDEMFNSLLIVFAYDIIVIVFNVIAIVMLSKAFKRRMITLDSGILPPPKKGRFANIFMSTGIAIAIAFFVLQFAFTLIEPMLQTTLTAAGG